MEGRLKSDLMQVQEQLSAANAALVSQGLIATPGTQPPKWLVHAGELHRCCISAAQMAVVSPSAACAAAAIAEWVLLAYVLLPPHAHDAATCSSNLWVRAVTAGSCSGLQERAEAKSEQRRSECKALHNRLEALQNRLQQKQADLELAGHQATLKASQLSATIQRCGCR